MTKRIRHLAAVGALAVASAVHAAPTTIDFDDLANGIVVGAHYAGLGVTFSDAETAPFGGLAGGSPPRAIVHDNPALGSMFGPADAIVATFAFPVAWVSLTGLDVGGAGFVMTAFDDVLGGSIVDTGSFTGVGLGVGDFHTLTLSGAGIRRVEFSQITAGLGGDGIAFDNLVFEAVPLPATPALLAAALLAAGLASRRWR